MAHILMTVRERNHDEFLALKSFVTGLHVDLDLMKDWTGAGGPGYSKNMAPAQAPQDWSIPGRLIWRFGFEAFPNLLSSPYLYRMRDLVEAFARLSFSISRLFQLYDEYRAFVNSDPGISHRQSGPPPVAYTNAVFRFNFDMHVRLIGGQDSDDPNCLYKAYAAATDALGKFDRSLKVASLPGWFWVGHVVSLACAVSGVFLLAKILCP